MKTLNQNPWQVEGGETLPLLYEIDQHLWLEETIKGSSVCVMQWTGVIRDGTLIEKGI